MLPLLDLRCWVVEVGIAVPVVLTGHAQCAEIRVAGKDDYGGRTPTWVGAEINCARIRNDTGALLDYYRVKEVVGGVARVVLVKRFGLIARNVWGGFAHAECRFDACAQARKGAPRVAHQSDLMFYRETSCKGRIRLEGAVSAIKRAAMNTTIAPPAAIQSGATRP